MGFAHPIMLAFLGLFLPVIALYLLKQRRRRVRVATLLFWDKILKDEQTVTSLARLRKLLSLLLQLLFIALLVLALARPLVSDTITGARRIVLFLDTSASMLVREGDGVRFDEAKSRALNLVKGLAQGDTMMLVTVDQHPAVVRPFTNSKRELEAAIETLSPAHTETDFAAALEILDRLPESRQDTQVYLVTDGAFPPVAYTPGEDLQFAYLRVGETGDNVGITKFQARPLPDSPRDFQVHLEVANETSQTVTAELEFRLNGALTDAWELTLPPRDSVQHRFSQYSATGGAIEVFLDFPDAFPMDNRAFGRLAPLSPIKVQLVMEEGNLFLESALLTDQNVALEVVNPAEAKPTENYDVTVWTAAPPNKTPAGNSVFVHHWPPDLGIVAEGELKSPLITEWERNHPINRHLALQNVTIRSARKITAPDSFLPLIRSFNDPLLLLQESKPANAGAEARKERKVLVFAFDPLATDLPLRVAFPILIANAVHYLQGRDGQDGWMNPVVGQSFSSIELAAFQTQKGANGSIHSENSAATGKITKILRPDHSEQDLSEPGDLLRADRVGLYQAVGEESTQPLFAVNLASSEESKIQPSPTLPIQSETPVREIVDGFRLGYEAWLFVALLAVFLSIAEWFLFHRRLIE